METRRPPLLTRVHVALACLLILGVVAYLLACLYVLANPAGQTIRFDENGVRGGLRVDRTVVVLPGDCLTATWQVEGAAHVALRDVIHAPRYSAELCGYAAEIAVTFNDGAFKTYSIDRRVLFAPPLLPLIVLAVAAIVIWQGLFARGRVSLSPQEYAVGAGRALADVLFSSRPSGRVRRLLVVFGLLALFAFGVDRWINFYNNGNLTLNSHDWARASAYNTVIAEAFQTGQVPFFTSKTINVTDQLMGNAEVSFAPVILLIPLLTPGQYALVNTLLFYAVGFAGCLLIRRRYRLSLVTFAVFFLLFNFNGHLIAHLSVGHAMWNGYFLLSFFLLLVFRMIDGDRPRRAALLLAPVLFGLALSGAVHIFVWCILALLLLGAFNRRLLFPALIAVVAGGLLAAVRFLPAAIAASGYAPDFIGGYPTPLALLDSMVAPHYFFETQKYRDPTVYLQFYHGLAYWELNLYVGLIGAAFVGYFGLFRHLFPGQRLRDLDYKALSIPVLALTLFAFSNFYAPIYNLSLPLLDAERGPARLIVVPVLLLLLAGCLRFERLLPGLSAGVYARLVVLTGVLLGGQALIEHMRLWRVFNFEHDWQNGPTFRGPVQIESLDWLARTTMERAYVVAAGVGLAVSLVAFAVWVWLYRRWRSDAAPVNVVAAQSDDAAPENGNPGDGK